MARETTLELSYEWINCAEKMGYAQYGAAYSIGAREINGSKKSMGAKANTNIFEILNKSRFWQYP